MKLILYKGGYKYQLSSDYSVEIHIAPEEKIETKYLSLSPTGKLCIRSGYAWDGPSGPTIDTKNFMRGSLVHDVLYQLIRSGHLKPELRNVADRLLQKMCREDGMSRLRAWWIYIALKYFGGAAADPSHKKSVLKAP